MSVGTGSLRAAALCAALALAAPLAAQESATPDSTVYLAGLVTDAATLRVIGGAAVRFLGESTGGMTDSLGVFDLRGLPPGLHLLSVAQFGYVTAVAPVTVPLPEGQYLDINLTLSPFALEGITVVADRMQRIEDGLRGRRNAIGFSVDAIEEDVLLRSTATDVRTFLAAEAGMQEVDCPPGVEAPCISRRGASTRPVVCIDDVRAFGGLQVLWDYRPQDLYMIEVFSGGSEIHAYTRSWVQRLLRLGRDPRSGVPC